MKRAAAVLSCLLILAFFHFSLAIANSNNSKTLEEHAFATPEQTWDYFKSAILSGDFDTAHKCCCQDETKSVLRFEKMDAAKRKSIVDSMGKLEKIVQEENTAKYKLPRTSKGATFFTYVYFAKENGDWKIAGY